MQQQEKAIREYYLRMLRKYFRKNPPIPTNIYLSGEALENEQLRVQVAQHCHFPSIINILANDESDLVRAAARNSAFWREIGRYQDILGFGKRERRAFARTEGPPNILVLLMFEDDHEVLNEVLHNPAVSLKILIFFQRLLKERGTGRKDEQLYAMTRHILSQRREQIIKISEINKASERLSEPPNVKLILRYFAEDDRTIHRSIENILSSQSPEVIRHFVNQAIEQAPFDNLLKYYVVLTNLIELIQRREDLKQIPISALKFQKRYKPQHPYHSVADFFLNMLTLKRQQIVRQSGADLTDLCNVTLIAHCHVAADPNLRAMASEIMSLDDILNLLNEVSTPRKVFRNILRILETHPDEVVAERVRETYMLESQRMRQSLKEMEISVQAYFDIIFQSLGYNKINEYLNVVRSIKTTEKQLSKFRHLLETELGSQKETLQDLLIKIKKGLQREADTIYFDTGPQITHELESIFELIEDVFKLKELGVDSIRPGTPHDIESEMRVSAGVIWQSAISIYLGRIKDLTEMIRKKILQAAGSAYNKTDLERDMLNAGDDLEHSYKEKVNCKLTNSCRVCGKRGCASERFLREAHFFIKEYLENFATAEEA